MLHRSFNRNLHKLLKKVEWQMYLVNIDNNYKCTCLGEKVNEGDINCPKCLGTGHRIKIRKINAVKQPYKASSRSSGGGTSLSNVVTKYYIDAKYGPVCLGDLLIHGNEIDVVKFVRTWRSDSSTNQYYECSAVLKKYNGNTVIENFNKLIK